VLLSRLSKPIKELNWGVLAIEMVILIVGFSVSLQVNGWQNRRDDRQLAREYLERLMVDFGESEKVLRIALANLYQSYQQTIRMS